MVVCGHFNNFVVLLLFSSNVCVHVYVHLFSHQSDYQKVLILYLNPIEFSIQSSRIMRYFNSGSADNHTTVVHVNLLIVWFNYVVGFGFHPCHSVHSGLIGEFGWLI